LYAGKRCKYQVSGAFHATIMPLPRLAPETTALVIHTTDKRGRPDGQFLSIQALRGVAAILVTIFHAGLRPDPTESTFRLGNAGVDIFFVISGFVMWTVVSRRPVTPATFLMHRAIRLIPLYWLATLLIVGAACVFPAEFPHLVLTPSHVLLSLGFIPHQAPGSGRIGPVLGQGWTLNFEIFFYLLFAAALALPARRRLPAIGAALVGATVLGFFAATPAAPVTSLLSPLLIEFLFGLGLAWLYGRGAAPPAWLGWGAAALGVGLLLFAAPGASDDLARLVEYGMPAALIVGGMVGVEMAGGLLVPKLARLLGDASYSIYLTHTFMISLVGKLAPPHWPAAVFMAVATPVAIAGGVGVYVVVERPLLGAMRRLTRGRPPGPVALRCAGHVT
jgi:exopolysaccharide production protein ExoZ